MADQKDFVVRGGISVPGAAAFGANVAVTNRLTTNVLVVNANTTMNAVTIQDLTVVGNSNITLTRGQVLRGYREYVTVATGVTGAFTIDLLDSNVFNLTLAANTTLSVANTPNTGISAAYTLIAKQPAGGGARLTWPAGTVWSEGVAPTQSLGANQTDVFTFMSVNGGVMWIGAHSFANVS